MQTEGGRQRSQGQPGPQGEPGLHLPVTSAVRRAAAGLPALRPDQGLAAHPAEGPGGEAEAGRGAAGGPFQQPQPVTFSSWMACSEKTRGEDIRLYFTGFVLPGGGLADLSNPFAPVMTSLLSYKRV